jgi:hypothetical protein
MKKVLLINASNRKKNTYNLFTLNSIKEVMVQWGVCLGGTIYRNGRTFNKPIKEKELEQFVKLMNSNGESYSPSFKEIYTYNIQRTLATNVFPVDKEYWQKKGWLDKVYFPGSKLNSMQKLYGNGIYKMLCKVIKPIK